MLSVSIALIYNNRSIVFKPKSQTGYAYKKCIAHQRDKGTNCRPDLDPVRKPDLDTLLSRGILATATC